MTQATAADTRIKCAICGAKVHAISIHLRDDHKLEEGSTEQPWTVERYEQQYPGQPLFSQAALDKIEENRKAKEAKEAPAKVGLTSTVSAESSVTAPTKISFHELFGLGSSAATLSSSGRPIPITVLGTDPASQQLVPDLDPNYVYNLDVLKTLLMGLEMNIPVYLWGHSGVGKTTIYEQIACKTRRPLFRVQHTANMEEEHVVGGWRLRDGKTFFEPGPLPMAMKHGWIYLADEYDFGRPEVTSVYQAVLEGKPLVIKEADQEHRVVRPHPNFRFIATGNTNGQGDESGLYAGTNLQNAANYERFGIVERMPYMERSLEERLVSQQAKIPMADAKKLVDYATRVREAFEGGTLGNPISPRSLIYAAKLGVAKQNYKTGLALSFINRLTATDRETASQVAQRVFA